MQIFLMSEVRGEHPIECREFLADANDVSWDEESSLPTDVAAVFRNARSHAERLAEAPMHLANLALQLVGPTDKVRYFYFTAHFQHAKGDGEPVFLVLDLNGKVVVPRLKCFDTSDAYARYAYGDREGA